MWIHFAEALYSAMTIFVLPLLVLAAIAGVEILLDRTLRLLATAPVDPRSRGALVRNVLSISPETPENAFNHSLYPGRTGHNYCPDRTIHPSLLETRTRGTLWPLN
jgi:hypothetical protein